MAEAETLSVTSRGGDINTFPHIREAAAYMVEQASEALRLTVPLGMPLEANVVGQDGQLLRLVSGEREVIVPRIMQKGDKGLLVSEAPKLGVDIIAYVEDIDSRVIHEGLAWVHGFPREFAHGAYICVGIQKEHGLGRDDLAIRMGLATDAVRKLINAALTGETELPYADYSPRSRDILAVRAIAFQSKIRYHDS